MIKQKFNWLSDQRVDTPHLKAEQEGVLYDFKSLLNFFVSGTPYILNGFNLLGVPGKIGGDVSNLTLSVGGATVWMPEQIDGAFLQVDPSIPDMVIQGNAKTIGSFTANVDNYVSIQFTRLSDPSTNDLVSFWDVESKAEFTKTVPLGLVLDYRIVINTTGFGTNCPIAIVNLSGSAVNSVKNCKQNLFRLGTGGVNPDYTNEQSPSPAHENPLLITSGAQPDPFVGGDWELGTFKEWMDMVMTRIKQLGGTQYWYDSSATISNINLSNTWHDAVGSILVGDGRFKHSAISAGTISWTSPIILKSLLSPRQFTFAGPGSDTLAENEVLYVKLVRNQDFDPTVTYTFNGTTTVIASAPPAVALVIGDYIKAAADPENAWRRVANIAGTTVTLDTAYPTSVVDKAVRSQGDYSALEILRDAPADIDANADVYWIAKRDSVDPTAWALTSVTRTSDISEFTTTLPHDLKEGQAIVVSGVADSTFDGIYEIISLPAADKFQVRNNGLDGSSTGGTAQAAARIYLRGLGELAQGEELAINNQVSNDTLAFIGAKSETDDAPEYLDVPTGSLDLPNFNAIANENLTARTARLTAMMADKWQDDNIKFSHGRIRYNRDTTEIAVPNATLRIPGVGRIIINPYGVTPTQTLAPDECLYVTYSRTSNAALTFQKATFSTFVPSHNQKICIVALDQALWDSNGPILLETERVYEVDFVDPITTTLPGTVPATIDGVSVAIGDYILYTALSGAQASSRNKVYQKQSDNTYGFGHPSAEPIFETFATEGVSNTPSNGALIRVRKGLAYQNQLGRYNSFTYTVTTCTRLTNESTFTLSTPHMMSVGDIVTVAGVADVTFNGVFTVIAVDYTLNTFKVSNPGTNASSSGGTAVFGHWDFNDVTRHFNMAGDYFEQSSLRTVTLANNATSNVFSIAKTATDNIIVDYSLVRGSTRESGQMSITHNGTSAEIAVNNAVMGLTGTTFAAIISGNDLVLQATLDNSTTATMKYSMKRWSDSPGGPSGLPAYQPITTYPVGLINSAFAMSDGSGIEIGCNPPTVVLGKTQLQLTWSYTMGINAGTTGGDLEVIVDGLVFPRYLAGVTLDAYFKEIDPYTIELNTDYSPSPVSIEIRKRYGTFDSSTQNANKIAGFYDFVIGSGAQVLSGQATHSSFLSCLAVCSGGERILVLKGLYTENVTINKNVIIEGKGISTLINGTLSFSSSADGCVVKFIQVAGNITFQAGSSVNFMTECWQDTGFSVTDSGTTNYYNIIGL